MEQFRGLFDAVGNPTSDNPSTSTSSENIERDTAPTPFQPDLHKIHAVLINLTNKVNQLENHLKSIDTSLQQLVQTSVLSTLPHHSQVVLNPRKGTQSAQGPQPKIM